MLRASSFTLLELLLHYETKIREIKNKHKKLWSLNDILGKKANSALSFIQSDGSFITKPTDIVNYFMILTLARLANLDMNASKTNADTTHPSIPDQIMTISSL